MAKFVTVHNKCSKNPTVDLRELGNPVAKMALCLSCVELHVPLCWQQRPTKSERAIRLVYPPVFLLTSFFIEVQIEKSDGFRSGVWNSSISVTIDNWTHVVATNVFTSRLLILSRTRILTFRPLGGRECHGKYHGTFGVMRGGAVAIFMDFQFGGGL